MNTRVFTDTPEFAAKTHTFIGAPLFPERGAVMGIELATGRVVFIDPAVLQEIGEIHSPVIKVYGQKRFAAKSTWLKSVACRWGAHQCGLDPEGVPLDFRTRVHGVKPANGEASEYEGMTQYFHGTSFLIEEASLNLLDPKMNFTVSDMVDSIVGAIEMIRNESPLPGLMVTAIQIGINKMLANEWAKAHASQNILRSILSSMSKEDLEEHEWAQNMQAWKEDPDHASDLGILRNKPTTVNAETFLAFAGEAAAALGQLRDGIFGNIFGGERSLHNILSSHFLHIMWGTTNDKGRALAEAQIMRAQKRALIRGELKLVPNLDISDELHGAVNIKTWMREQNAWIKEIRAYPSYLVRATQYETDESKAGEAGSEIRGLAENMLKGTGMRILGLQPSDPELEALYLKHGMSKQQVNLLRRLQVGCYAILIENRPPIFYQHILTPTEFRLSDTMGANRALLNRVPVMQHDELTHIAATNGVIQVGRNDKAEVW